MTIKELKDYLYDNFPDGCEDESNKVLIVDDGMKPKYFQIDFCAESTIDKLNSNEYNSENILMLVTDLTNEYK